MLASLLLPHFAALALITASATRAATLPALNIIPNPNPSNCTPAPIAASLGAQALDGVHVPLPNATSYEWWFFDAVAADSSAAIGFQPTLNYANTAGALTFRLSLVWPNGTLWSADIPVDKMWVADVGMASSGVARGGKFSWTGSPDLSLYEFLLDWPEVGVAGSITMQPIAPPHASCGPAGPDASLEFKTDLFWANPIPDSQTTVNLVINGTSFVFEGSGYHDQNWGGSSFIPSLNQWYWSHSRPGPYSLVAVHHLASDASVQTSVYLAMNGTILFAGCGNSTVDIRPYGPNVTYPLPLGWQANASVQGYEISFDAGDLGRFEFVTTKTLVAEDEGVYTRWIGTIEGGKVGEANETGPAVWDMMGPFPDEPIIF